MSNGIIKIMDGLFVGTCATLNVQTRYELGRLVRDE